MTGSNKTEKFDKTNLTVNSQACGVNAVVYAGIGAGKNLAQAMSDAKKDIKICSPFVSVKRLTELAERAKNDKDLKILLITSFSEDTNDNNDDIKKALAECSKYMKIVVYNYVPHDQQTDETLATSLQLHAKFWLLDNKILYITSSNFTAGGIQNNFETRIRIEKGEKNSANDYLVGLYRDLFEKLEKNIGNFKLWNLEDFK